MEKGHQDHLLFHLFADNASFGYCHLSVLLILFDGKARALVFPDHPSYCSLVPPKIDFQSLGLPTGKLDEDFEELCPCEGGKERLGEVNLAVGLSICPFFWQKCLLDKNNVLLWSQTILLADLIDLPIHLLVSLLWLAKIIQQSHERGQYERGGEVFHS